MPGQGRAVRIAEVPSEAGASGFGFRTDSRYASTMAWYPERFRQDGTRICSMADALEVVGDRWALHVIREIGTGVSRFDGIRRRTGAPREMLSSRLRKLERTGVITRTPYSERPLRYEYALTAAGEDLIPVMAALYAWGEQYATPEPSDDAGPDRGPAARGGDGAGSQ